MQKLIDIEVYRNRFILGIADYHTEIRESFEIHANLDQRVELRKFLSTYQGFWVSFNGIRYDNIVLAYGQRNRWFPELTADQCCLKLKQFSDSLINSEDDDFYSSFKKYQNYFNWIDIDLYLYWSKLLRISRKISLKALGIQLGYPVVQELPYDPAMWLSDSQWEEVKVYNLQHDLGILLMLTKEMQDHILIRATVAKQTGLNVWSMDAPKIASESLLQDYCNKTGLDPWTVRKYRFPKPDIVFRDLFENFNPDFTNKTIIKLYNDLLNSVNSFDQEIALFNKDGSGLKITVANGGIHSVNKYEQYFSDDDHVLIDSDIASLYPRLIELLQVFRFPEVNQRYSQIKELRLTESKPNFKKAKLSGDSEKIQYWKLQDEFYKLVLNSTSGLIDMEHSWLYNPEKILQLRLTGQMILLRCIQDCINRGWKVFSTNTDGLTVKIPRKDLEAYKKLIDDIGAEFGVDFEHETFKSIHYEHINSYIALTETGLVKKKGTFVTKPELSTSVDNLVISKLLQCYYESGIKPEDILDDLDNFEYNWDGKIQKLHIYDFCASQKVDKSYTVQWNNKPQQRLNRYYVSRQGAYLYKVRNKRATHMLKGFGVQIYNDHIEQPLSKYPIDKSYYLSQINALISEIENKKQLSLL